MNSSPGNFTAKSPLYWLCGAFALGLTLVGLLAIFTPVPASIMFGMPASTIEAIPWVRLAGIRDVALGLVFFVMMTLKQGRATGILMLLAVIVPITDAITVFLRSGLSYQIFIHGSSVIFMIIIGMLLIRSK
jgi:hypothetical protein